MPFQILAIQVTNIKRLSLWSNSQGHVLNSKTVLQHSDFPHIFDLGTFVFQIFLRDTLECGLDNIALVSFMSQCSGVSSNFLPTMVFDVMTEIMFFVDRFRDIYHFPQQLLQIVTQVSKFSRYIFIPLLDLTKPKYMVVV